MPLVLLFATVLFALAGEEALAGIAHSAGHSAVVSKDVAKIKLGLRRKSIVVDYVVPIKGRNPSSRREVVRIPSEFYESTFFAVSKIDLFHDNVPAIEVTGGCGNKACEKIIFRYSERVGRYVEFFRGAYSSVSLLDDYLVEAGASGCCSFEYHAYKIPSLGRAIVGPPQIVVSIKNGVDDAECYFANSAGASVEVPNHKWLRFCEVYGDSYTLTK